MKTVTITEETKQRMNVSKEADAEFVRLLEIEDPARHANLFGGFDCRGTRSERSARPEPRMREGDG